MLALAWTGVVLAVGVAYGLVGRLAPQAVDILAGVFFGGGWIVAYPAALLLQRLRSKPVPSFSRWFFAGVGAGVVGSIVGTLITLKGI